MFHLFETLILPILTYGSDVWGSNKSTLTILDRVFLRFIRCTLGIECTTSNIIVLGECGRMPPSVMCTINTLCFFNRLNCMDDDSLVKQVYMELQRLTEHGFDTWVSSLRKLADSYQLNAYVDPNKFRQECKIKVRSRFVDQWTADMNDINSYPILITYRHIKVSFRTEPYICLVKDKRYRHAIPRLRCSSHMLHIEKGRYTRPKTPLNERLGYSCHCIEDELHLVTACSINVVERRILFSKVADKYPGFDNLDDIGKFVFLLTFEDAQMLTWLGKFLYKSFAIKASQSREIYIWLEPMSCIYGGLAATRDVGDCQPGSLQRLWCRQDRSDVGLFTSMSRTNYLCPYVHLLNLNGCRGAPPFVNI